MNRIGIIILVLVSTITISDISALPWGIPDDITFIGLEKSLPQLKKTAISVQYLPDNTSKYIFSGSGFIALTKDKKVFGVTCEHVIRKPLKNGHRIFIGVNTDKGFERIECIVPFANKEKDIALLLPRVATSTPMVLKNVGFEKKHFASKTEIIEGRGILMVGYPLGLGLEYDENNPIVRFGIISQYTGRSHILIDATPNQGYSGSPVFDNKNEKIIGMMKAYPSDYIDLFDSEERLSAKIPYNSGIGLAISSELLSQAISEYIGSNW